MRFQLSRLPPELLLLHSVRPSELLLRTTRSMLLYCYCALRLRSQLDLQSLCSLHTDYRVREMPVQLQSVYSVQQRCWILYSRHSMLQRDYSARHIRIQHDHIDIRIVSVGRMCEVCRRQIGVYSVQQRCWILYSRHCMLQRDYSAE